MAISDQLIMRSILSSLKDSSGKDSTLRDKAIAGLSAISASASLKDSRFRDIVIRRVLSLTQ